MKHVIRLPKICGHQIRYHSVFVKMFLLVLIVLSFILGGFSFYLFHMENKNLEKNAEDSRLSLLKTTGTATELTLKNLQQMMKQTLWGKDFTSVMVTSSSRSYDQTSSIIKQLKQIVDDSTYVEKAYLYVPTEDQVYSSDLFCLAANQTPDALFRDAESLLSFAGSRLSEDEDSLILMKSWGRMYLCQHLYPNYLDSIGMLIFRINISSLDLSLLPNGDSISGTCYVFDAEGESVFMKSVPVAVQHAAEQLLANSVSLTEGVLKSDEEWIWFYYRSPESGWIYLYPDKASQFNFMAAPGKILVAALIILFFGILIALQIAFRANKPIRNLMKEIPEKNRSTIQAKNEVDYLTKAYHYTTEQNEQMHQAIRSVTPLVLERLFSDILSGRSPEEEDIQSTLESLESPFPSGARFMVMSMEILSKSGKEITAAEMGIDILQLRDFAEQNLPENYQGYLVQREDPFAALILAFPVAEEEMVIQRQIVEFCRRLDNQKHTTSYEVRMGCGNIYDRLKDIRYSWLEAQKKLNHIRFYGVDEPESGTSLLPYQNHYFEQARQIIRAARDQRLEEARQQLDDITSVMAKQTISGENPGKNCREFLDALLELTEALHVVNVDELLRRQKEQLFIRLDTGEDQAEMINQVKEFCVQLLELVARRNKTKSSQHVERIREYIHTNYSDSSLSLYMAAEQVGLSPSYLSRLFKQEMGASFVDYISSVRVEKAKELLESSDLMVKDIAYQTGFNSMQNFFRIFKKQTGIAPGEYRSAREYSK